MSEQEKFFSPEDPMTPDDLYSILANNIAGARFVKHAGPKGNIERHPDKIVKVDFNPFDPKTWRNNEIRIKQYQIEINPMLSLDEQAKTFLRNIMMVRFELQKGVSGRVMSFANARQLAREEILIAEAESERFYKEYPEQVLEILQDFK